MDHEKNNIRKNWALIETTISANWPEEWLQANPLEIKALEEIIDNHKSLNEEITEVPGGMGCDFFVDLEDIFYLLAILSYLQGLLGLKDEDIRQKVRSFIETCNKEMQDVYKNQIEPKLNELISLMKKK